MVVRRSVLMLALGLVVLLGAAALTSCQPSDAPGSVPEAVEQDQSEESYPGGVPPSQQGLPTSEEGYPGTQEPTPVEIPERSYPAPGETGEASTGEGTEAPGVAAEAICADTEPGMIVYEDEDGAYCFQYPDDLDILAPGVGDERRIVTIAPAGTEAGQPSVSGIVMSVEALGPVDVATADELADEVLSGLGTDASGLDRSEITFGDDLLGVVVDGIPGAVVMRQAFLVHDGSGYTFLIFPWEDEEQPEMQDDAQALWQAVVSSLTFTTPERSPSE